MSYIPISTRTIFSGDNELTGAVPEELVDLLFLEEVDLCKKCHRTSNYKLILVVQLLSNRLLISYFFVVYSYPFFQADNNLVGSAYFLCDVSFNVVVDKGEVSICSAAPSLSSSSIPSFFPTSLPSLIPTNPFVWE